MAFHMNKQRGAHMDGKKFGGEAGDVNESTGQHHMPHIHHIPHNDGSGRVTVHIHHHGGGHEKHVHEAGDTDGMAAHVHEHMGGEEGQDHGYSSGTAEEDELGAGPGV